VNPDLILQAIIGAAAAVTEVARVAQTEGGQAMIRAALEDRAEARKLARDFGAWVQTTFQFNKGKTGGNKEDVSEAGAGAGGAELGAIAEDRRAVLGRWSLDDGGQDRRSE
jgi:hypothetical protein